MPGGFVCISGVYMELYELKEEAERVILVGVSTRENEDVQDSLDELSQRRSTLLQQQRELSCNGRIKLSEYRRRLRLQRWRVLNQSLSNRRDD